MPYSIAAARAELTAIIDQAEDGHDVELTRHGKPVAVVVSIRTYERLKASRAKFSQAYAGFRRRYPLADVGLPKDFAAALRDKSPGRRVSV